MNPYDEVREQLDLTWETWVPSEIGETLIGTVRHRFAYSNENHTDYPFLVIEPEEGDALLGVHCFQTVLWQEVEMRDPRPGDAIGIRYLGKGQSDRSDYHRFQVRVVKASADSLRSPAEGDGAGEQLPSPAAAQAESTQLPAEAHAAAGAVPHSPDEVITARNTLVDLCQREGVNLAAALNTANPGTHYTSHNAHTADLAEVEHAIAWVASRALKGADA